MKCFNLRYYLLAVLCVLVTSCTSDGAMDDFPDNGALVAGAHISFVINFPTSSSTRSGETVGDELEKERYIDDVHVYTFQDDKFVEEIQYLMIDNANGDANRIIDGKLLETYSGDLPMEFVVIANAGKVGVGPIEMDKSKTKAELYKQLIFIYDKEQRDWSEYIPMWGLGVIQQVKADDDNFGELELIRAVAKVNVTVNGGAGLENFEITEIRLHGYNTKGYCAPTQAEGPSIPSASEIASDYLTSGVLSGGQGNKFENKFYIPEHKNVGVQAERKVYLTIQAKVRDVAKTYAVQFSTGERDYDILRNNLYVLNITSVDEVTASLNYEVAKWEEINVDVPSFD